LISLPSVIPLLALNWGVDAATAASAHWIYVYYRLPHHLIASEFRWDFLLRFEAMVVVWAILCRAIREYEYDPLREIEDHQLLRGFIVGALAIALAGAALSALVSDHPALAARLLRFYWFRLSDVAVPLGVALFGVCWILQLWREGEGYNTGGSWTWSPSPRGPSAALRGPYSSGSSWKYVFFAMPSRSRGLMGWLVLVAAATAAVWHVADFVRLRIQVASGVKPAIPRADLKVDKLGGYAAWREACEWIATSGVIPAHARFLTPIDGQTFKWLTRRAEVVSRKDVPQDAASIVVWWERLRDIHGIGADEPRRYWHTSLAELPVERLRELGAKYGAAYILTEAPGVRLPEVELPETGISPPKPAPRLNLKELHSNSGYIIYAIAPP
jgi:hypothetical protein